MSETVRSHYVVLFLMSIRYVGTTYWAYISHEVGLPGTRNAQDAVYAVHADGFLDQ